MSDENTSPNVEINLFKLMGKLKQMQQVLNPIQLSSSDDKSENKDLLNLFQSCCATFDDGQEDAAWNNHLKIRLYLKKLFSNKSTPTTIYSKLSGYDRNEKLLQLMNWCKDQGVDTRNVEIHQNEKFKGFGLNVIRDLKIGEVILEIPRHLFLGSDYFLSTGDIFNDFLKSDPFFTAMPNVSLALGLLYEFYKGESSWLSYINSLPAYCDNICNFKLEHIYKLKGSSFFLEAMNIWKSIVRQYAYIHIKLYGISPNKETENSVKMLNKQVDFVNKFNIEDYFWAVSIVMSRNNPLFNEKTKSYSLVLIPLLDLCNHAENGDMIYFNNKKQTYFLNSSRDMEKGSEIFMFYGQRSSSSSLINNGFFLKDNNFDVIMYRFRKMIESGCIEKREKLLNFINIENMFYVLLNPKSKVWDDSQLKNLYMVVYMTDQEYEKALQEVKNEEMLVNFINNQLSEVTKFYVVNELMTHINIFKSKYMNPDTELPVEFEPFNWMTLGSSSSKSNYLDEACKALIQNEICIFNEIMDQLQTIYSGYKNN